MERTRSWLAQQFSYPELLTRTPDEATPHERRLVAYVTTIVGRVMIVSTLLFAVASGTDGFNFHGTWATFPVRMLGILALLGSMAGWLYARRHGRTVLTGIMGALFSTSMSVSATLISLVTHASFEIAMTYGLVIAIFSAMLWQSAPAVVVGSIGTIGPPYLNMVSQHPSTQSMVDFTIATGVTVMLVFAAVRVQAALIRELSTLRTQLVIESNRDPLTGLSRRQAWLTGLANWETMHPGEPYEILFFDLDHFKAVNDRFGHDAGDRVLIAFATILREHLPAGSLAARFGGDEFVAFIPGTDRDIVAFSLALANAIGTSALHDLNVDVSIGRAASSTGSRGEELLWQADQALLERKRHTRKPAAPVVT